MDITADEMVKMWEAVRAMHPTIGWGVVAFVPHSDPLDDGSCEVRITFKDVTYASSWFRMVTSENPEPEVMGPVQFANVAMIPATSFTSKVRVRATLRREWIEWWVSFNLRQA